MIARERLRGCGTALVTPFRKDESIDEESLRRLIDEETDFDLLPQLATDTDR